VVFEICAREKSGIELHPPLANSDFKITAPEPVYTDYDTVCVDDIAASEPAATAPRVMDRFGR
jgi:hypothetical protein